MWKVAGCITEPKWHYLEPFWCGKCLLHLWSAACQIHCTEEVPCNFPVDYTKFHGPIFFTYLYNGRRQWTVRWHPLPAFPLTVFSLSTYVPVGYDGEADVLAGHLLCQCGAWYWLWDLFHLDINQHISKLQIQHLFFNIILMTSQYRKECKLVVWNLHKCLLMRISEMVCGTEAAAASLEGFIDWWQQSSSVSPPSLVMCYL